MRVSKPPEERRAELLEAARRLFDQRGVDKTRVADIVAAVGVAQGVFYYYFPSKEAVVREVVQKAAEDLEERVETALGDQAASFEQKLSRLIELYIDMIDQFMGDDETRMPRDDAATTLAGQWRGILDERLKALVQSGAEQGRVTAPYPAETATVLLEGLMALAGQSLPARKVVYAIVEQGLGLPRGALKAEAPPP